MKPLRVYPAAGSETEQMDSDASDLSIRIMLSKPVLALEFNCMNMNVEAPFVVAH